MLVTPDVINFSKEVLITNHEQLNRVIEESRRLAEQVEAGNSELMPVLEIMTRAIGEYEDEHYPISDSSTPEERMVFLMEQHGDTQSDMTDVASRTVINEIVNGKRKLNRRHIEALCRKYGVRADYFLFG